MKDLISYFAGQVRVYVHNGGEHEVITTNLNNKIDITRSSNHTSVYKNPGPFGTPNSSVDILDARNGSIKTRILYDSSGAAYMDVDMTNHGNPRTHPEYPHEHVWKWIDKQLKRIEK